MRPVTNKLDGMRRWNEGEFGNRLRSWKTLGACMADTYDGRIGLRYLDPRGGGTPWEAHVEKSRVPQRVQERTSTGLLEKHTLFCEEAPDHRLIMNGEYHDLHGFYHSRVKKPMRAALKEGGRFADVPRARLMLRQCMTPSSWADFEALTEMYPGHVIELSVYECTLGILPGRNTIVWEVRRY